MSNFEKELSIAIKAAKSAGEYLAQRSNLHVDSQEGKDIKLAADRESESIIIKALSQTGLPIISEESGAKEEIDQEKCYWIVDPIDGTMNYFRRLEGLSCVSIALWKYDQPILGVVNRFELAQVFTGMVGYGAFNNGKPIKTSGMKQISQAILATGFPVGRDYTSKSLQIFINQAQSFKKVRMLGSAALMGVLVASGQVDAYVEDDIMLWDIAAAAAIVISAGGEFIYRPLADNKCQCKFFASKMLAEEYDAEII